MIKREDIQHVAKLAKLEFEAASLEGFTEEFNAIIELVEHLNEVDTDGVEPTYHGNDLINVFRSDEAQVGVNRDLMMTNVKTSQDGFIKVPAIMEGGEA